MADITPDPFEQVYTAIWTALNASTGFTALVKVGNQIRFDKTFVPGLKRSKMRADWPQVILLPDGGEWTFMRTNPSSRCVRDYRLVIVSGIEQYVQAHSDTEWQATRALAQASFNLGLSFVKAFQFGTFTFTDGPVPELAGSAGYMTEMPLQADMFLSTSALTTD